MHSKPGVDYFLGEGVDIERSKHRASHALLAQNRSELELYAQLIPVTRSLAVLRCQIMDTILMGITKDGRPISAGIGHSDSPNPLHSCDPRQRLVGPGLDTGALDTN